LRCDDHHTFSEFRRNSVAAKQMHAVGLVDRMVEREKRTGFRLWRQFQVRYLHAAAISARIPGGRPESRAA
jgi:hypothetical protein